MDAIRRLALLRNALRSATSPLARQLLDVCATAAIVAVLVSMGARALDFALARTQAAEAISLAQTRMLDAALANAESGRWPETPRPTGDRNYPASFVDRVDVGENGRVHMFFLSDAHPSLRGRHATIEPVRNGGGATLRWRLVEDDTLEGEPVDPILIPHAWRLEDKEP